jgi:hypothetical protein
VKFLDERKETLLSLAGKGIKPNVPLHIVKVEKDHLVLCVAGKEQMVSRREAEGIWVKAIRGEANV